jgi:acetylornithine deacetylase/succinyl-diaminopimelate desuccinylase-like protein
MNIQDVYSYIESNSDRFLDEFRTLLRQKSLSATGEGVEECAELLRDMMVESGINTQIVPTDGTPIVYGEVKSKHARRTLLMYAHYDVRLTGPQEYWDHPPFAAEMTDDGRIHARGAADCKDGVLAGVKAAEAFLRMTGDVPVNLKFIYEGDEEQGSKWLGQFLRENRGLIGHIDEKVTFDAEMDPSGRPTIMLGGKGTLRLELLARSADVKDPIFELIRALNTMKDPDGRVLIDGFYENVRPPTEEEMELMKKIPFVEDGAEGMSLTRLKMMDKRLYEPRIEFSEVGWGPYWHARKIGFGYAQVYIATVEDQMPDKTIQLVKDHLKKHGFDSIQVQPTGRTIPPPGTIPPSSEIVNVVRGALEKAYGEEVVIYPRSSGGGPRDITYHEIGLTGVTVRTALPGSNQHAPNEWTTRDQFIRNIKAAATIIDDYGKL